MLSYNRCCMDNEKQFIILLSILISIPLILAGFLYFDGTSILDKSFYLAGNDNVYVEYGNRYTEEGFKAIIDGVDYKDKVLIDNNINYNKLGTYEITYTLKYKRYSKTIIRNVHIIDSIPPNLTINCDKEIYIAVNSKFKGCSYKAIDNYDNDITDKVEVTSDVNTSKKGTYSIKYLVSDSNKNSIAEEIVVHVKNKKKITYVKIVLSKQKLYYYKNNKLVLTTPVTTGRKNATKTGTFRIQTKVRDATLKGKDYESKVKYWMGYNGSFGIHDASWRNNFGNKNYYYNGSHGCVNLPTKKAKQLFEMIEVGTPVYIVK